MCVCGGVVVLALVLSFTDPVFMERLEVNAEIKSQEKPVRSLPQGDKGTRVKQKQTGKFRYYS